MKLVFRGIAAIVVLVLGCNYGLHAQERQGKLVVYYFPIGAETLTPITSINIEERGRRCEIHPAKDIRIIKNALDSATRPSSQKFSDTAVRMKLIEISDTGDRLLALVENDGQVRFATAKEGVISRKGMEAIRKVIEAQFNK